MKFYDENSRDRVTSKGTFLKYCSTFDDNEVFQITLYTLYSTCIKMLKRKVQNFVIVAIICKILTYWILLNYLHLMMYPILYLIAEFTTEDYNKQRIQRADSPVYPVFCNNVFCVHYYTLLVLNYFKIIHLGWVKLLLPALK